MQKKYLGCLLGMIIPIVCTSCQILPKEEELPANPVIKEYTKQEYKQVSVLQGDLVFVKMITCKYKILEEEKLSFSLGSRNIKGIYVQEGQSVKAGDLLAELEHDDYQDQIIKLEQEIEFFEIQKRHVLENQELELQYPDIDKDLIEKEYDQKIQKIEDSLSIKRLQLNEITEKLKERQIRATISGVVTYVSSYSKGEKSEKGKHMITVANINQAISYLEGENAKYFSIGQQITITFWQKEYSAIVVSGISIGLPEMNESGEPIIYFKLLNPDSSISNGDYGKIKVLVDQRENVLYITKKAVQKVKGETFVYILDEEDRKLTKKVVTGLETDEYVEIISGLKKDDKVILE